MAGSSVLPPKRMHPDSNNPLLKLSADERRLYELIESRKNVGLWTGDMKKETGFQQTTVLTKILKSLQNKNLIKQVVNIHSKSKKTYMATKYEPSNEISGGPWYDEEGKLDTQFVRIMKEQCSIFVERVKVAAVENIWQFIKDLKVHGEKLFTSEPTKEHILEILNMLVLDKEVEAVKSSGTADFLHVPPGKVCYRSLKSKEGPKEGVFATIPCGV